MIKHGKYFVFIFLFTSCSHATIQYNRRGQQSLCSVPKIVVISDNYPDKWKEPIISALSYWNVVMEKRVFFYGGRFPSDDEIPMGVIVVRMSDTVNNNCAQAENSIGRKGCILGASILVRETCMNKLSLEQQDTVFRHELGHVLGLSHSDWSDELMWPGLIKRGWQHPKNASEHSIEAVNTAYKHKYGF